MRITKWLAALTALVLTLTAPALVLAENTAATPEKVYTAQEMLTMAIQDTYRAQAQYAALKAAFPAKTRFNALNKVENAHLALLTALMEAYGYEVPENLAAGQAAPPATLAEAYTVALKAEAESMVMYEAFLGQKDLPRGLKSAFTTLRNASQQHLNAFVRAIEGNGLGTKRNNK